MNKSSSCVFKIEDTFNEVEITAALLLLFVVVF